MYLSTIDLYELGQYLRIILWICLPLIIISLLVTTWLHYRRRMLDPGGLHLSMEGLDNAIEPEGMPHMPGEPLSYREREHDPDDSAERDPNSRIERNPDNHTQRDPADDDQWGKESVTEWKGKDNIYQGILWMKEKYEQYRDQADQRYELLKEELNRSERRYQDLLLSIEENKSNPPATVEESVVVEELVVIEGSVVKGDMVADGEGTADTAALDTLEAQYSQARQQLDARQLIIDELEEQLRIERLKVEELVTRLQGNSQLLLNIYQELDKSVHIAKEAE
jgi:hypothetical protein